MKPYRHEPIKTGATTPKNLRIDLKPAEELKPKPADARIHSKKQIRQIANSIEAFGLNVPVLVDAELNVISARHAASNRSFGDLACEAEAINAA